MVGGVRIIETVVVAKVWDLLIRNVKIICIIKYEKNAMAKYTL
jgi:hypothetical protein